MNVLEPLIVKDVIFKALFETTICSPFENKPMVLLIENLSTEVFLNTAVADALVNSAV